MSGNGIGVWVIEWDDDIIEGVCPRLAAPVRRASRAKAVSLLTGAFASAVMTGGRPDRLIAHMPDGKPYMPGLEHITVSISHHDRCAAVSVSAIPHGVDIELVRPVNERLFPRVFSPEELAVCSGLSDGRQEEYFFRIWTRKEALIKTGAITLGGMHTVCADGDTLSYRGNTHYFYTYSSGPLTPGCILSVCSRGTPAGPVLYTADRTSKLDAAAVLDRLYFDKQ